MRTTISLPDDLLLAAERAAERQGLTRSELFQRALTRYLAAQTRTSVTETLDDVYGSGKVAAVSRVLHRMQRASLPREDW